jgi:hypothetical protein
MKVNLKAAGQPRIHANEREQHNPQPTRSHLSRFSHSELPDSVRVSDFDPRILTYSHQVLDFKDSIRTFWSDGCEVSLSSSEHYRALKLAGGDRPEIGSQSAGSSGVEK